ncbi:MAG: guanylate kinase [Planctomycetales bacterium]|nr:guanylate kinase [Planctomycetales bacterium]
MWSNGVAERGRLIILSGPSGAGKSTVVRELLSNCPLPLVLSVSATTRPQRPGEQHGRDYYFVSKEQFEHMRAAGEFLECKEVFGRGDWYGTPAQQVEAGLAAGKWVLLEIDVQGALSVLKKHPAALSFFVHPGSLEELAIRLRRRGTDSETAIERRLEVAAEELQALKHYQHEIINREVHQSASEICKILRGVPSRSPAL